MNVICRCLLILSTLAACASSATSAQLSGWSVVPTDPVDLTAEGTLDWAHWGFGGDKLMNHKSGGGGRISALTGIKRGVFGNHSYGVAYRWSDGVPTAMCPGAPAGVRMIDAGSGASFTVPADPEVRTVTVYLSTHNALGRIQATISDSSAPAWTDATFFPSGSDGVAAYTLCYAAGKPGQTLTVTVQNETRLGDWDSINLHAVTLRDGVAKPDAGAAPPAPTLTALAGDGRVALRWTRLPLVSSYNIYRSKTATPGAVWRAGVVPFSDKVTPAQGGFEVEAVDATATNGTTWHYWVAAVGAGGEGAKSAEATAAPSPDTPRHLTILPLGDSITFGVPDRNGGYRPQLLAALRAAGYTVAMAGSCVQNAGKLDAPGHEGWPGRSIEQLRDSVVDRAIGTYQPDVILLMIGTNNLAWGDKKPEDVTNALAAYDTLLARILAAGPKSCLIVSPILPIGNGKGPSKQPLVDSFNSGLHAKVKALAKAGKLVSWADKMAAITLDQLGDGVHPKPEAYPAMGDAWAAAVQALPKR